MPDYNEKIYDQIKRFLETIHYTGFANFDMKYDERDGEYKLFEINLRQGRSSFYVTLGGYNLAKFLVDDYVLETPFKETIYGKANKLWIGVPKGILKKYIVAGSDKNKALTFISEGKYGTTINYKKDMSFKRFLLVQHMFYTYYDRYKTYFKQK